MAHVIFGIEIQLQKIPTNCGKLQYVSVTRLIPVVERVIAKLFKSATHQSPAFCDPRASCIRSQICRRQTLVPQFGRAFEQKSIFVHFNLKFEKVAIVSFEQHGMHICLAGIGPFSSWTNRQQQLAIMMWSEWPTSHSGINFQVKQFPGFCSWQNVQFLND